MGRRKGKAKEGCLEDLAENLVRHEGARRTVESLEVAELLEHALLGSEILVREAAEGKHSKTRVLDLGKLVLLELVGVLALLPEIRVSVPSCAPVSNGRPRCS